MDIVVLFAGTSASVPTPRRGLPALLMRLGGDRVLIDCGEGTQRQLARSVGLPDVDDVFITHFHADHWLGLPGLLKTWELRGREKPLVVHGPPGLERRMSFIRRAVGWVKSYEITLHELEPLEAVERTGYLIAPFPVDHGNHCTYGYRVVEDEQPGRFHPETARELGVTPGPDYGRLQRGETVEVETAHGRRVVTPEEVMDEPRRGRRIVVSGDTRPCAAVGVMAQEADLLVHEATFLDDERARAQATSHSTAREAGELAASSNVRALALTHLSTRHFARAIEDEARTMFPDAWVPRDFDALDLRYADRGGAVRLPREEAFAQLAAQEDALPELLPDAASAP